VNFDKNVTAFFQPATWTQIDCCIVSDQEALMMEVKHTIFTDHERSRRFKQISLTGTFDEHKRVDFRLKIFIIQSDVLGLR
jgi:hypothetical protein